MPAAKDYTGQKFNRLEVIERLKKNGCTKYRCACDCGKETLANGDELVRGHKKSCGCLQKEVARTYGKANLKHGHYRDGKASPTYTVWKAMINRCQNPKDPRYARYGGRGIEVCVRWRKSFEAFLEDMGIRPEETQIDRINNDGNYEPGNCRWATRSQNRNNTSINVMIEWQGERMSAKEWSRKLGMSYQALIQRVWAGWSVEDTLTKPVRVSNRKKVEI